MLNAKKIVTLRLISEVSSAVNFRKNFKNRNVKVRNVKASGTVYHLNKIYQIWHLFKIHAYTLLKNNVVFLVIFFVSIYSIAKTSGKTKCCTCCVCCDSTVVPDQIEFNSKFLGVQIHGKIIIWPFFRTSVHNSGWGLILFFKWVACHFQT